MASTTTTTFTLPPGLKLDSASSLAPHTHPLTTTPTTITTLNLSGTTLGVPAAQHLSTLLPALTNLRTANLADIFTGRLLPEIPPALSALLTALLACPRLEDVNLSDNAFGRNTAAPLVAFLERHTPLRRLVLNNNGLGPEAGGMVARALGRLAEAKEKARDVAVLAGEEEEEGRREGVPRLETVVCGRNRLENGSMAAWAEAVARHGEGLREVRMVQNGIRQEGVAVLFRDGLRRAKGLRVLDLQDNTFTRSGARVLAEVLRGWRDLGDLGVGDCFVGSRGMVMVAEALGKGGNEGLKVLRLQYNEIDARGVGSLVKAVEGGALPRLRRVEINGNKLAEEDAAVERLRELLKERREKAGKGDDEGGPDDWGIDELSDLDEDSDSEEDDVSKDEDAEEQKDREERDLKQTDEAENENVPEEKDKEVDALADQLDRTGI